jgi:predicted HD phosphohydrolase
MTMETVQFTRMENGTREEYQLLHRLEAEYIAALPDRILASLRQLDGGLAGYRVTRLEHSLQTATRAQSDGADIEMVVAALLHDIGDELAPDNHSQLAAAIIRPYVRAEVTWTVAMHGLFQLRYYGHHVGLDPDARDDYRDHPW